jgi:hypothetical protein
MDLQAEQLHVEIMLELLVNKDVQDQLHNLNLLTIVIVRQKQLESVEMDLQVEQPDVETMQKQHANKDVQDQSDLNL